MRILCFGDSIAQGFYDSKGGWVQRLASHYHKLSLSNMLNGHGQYVEVYNLGVSGDTAAGLLKRIESEVNARHLYDDEDIIVIAIGANDAILRENRAVMEIYDFQKYIEEIFKQANNLSRGVICVGLVPVDESLTDPWKFSRSGKQWKNNRINLFEDTIKQAATLSEVRFVPIYDRMLAEMKNGTILHSDGLHPNDKGHQFIAYQVKSALEKLR